MRDWDDDQQQPETPGSSGKLLMLFFIAVIAAAIAIGLGYTMGKHSGPADNTGATSSPTPAATNGAAKPGAGREPAPAPAEAAEASPSPTSAAAKPSVASPAPAKTPPPASAKAPEMAANPGKGIMVQVAALTRQDDAENLAGNLRKKQYPVLILPPSGGDKFYHVQVGPFGDPKDADAMKAKLIADGYNAIVKK
jgi:cell division septation protein DedD